MAVIDLIDKSFFEDLEKDVITSIGVSLTRAKKVVTARTIKSVRAETVISGEVAEISGYGGGGLPYIVKDKPAGTKYPMVKVGDRFELMPHIKDWKAIVGFTGSDFLLARAIATKPRKAVDIATPAIAILEQRVGRKIIKRFGTLFNKSIVNSIADGNT